MSVETERERASQAIAEAYQSSFFNLYWRAIGLFLGKGRPSSIWVSAAAVMVGNLLLGVAVSALLGETQFTALNAILVNVMWVTWTYLGVSLTIIINGRMVEFLQQRVTRSLRSERDVRDLLQWANQWLGKQIPQLLVSLGLGISIALLAFRSIYPASRFALGPVLIYFVNFFHISIATYGLLSLIAFVLKLQDWSLLLYTDDPASSPILLELSNELRSYMLYVSGGTALLLLLAGSVHALTITTALIALVVVWIPILILFVLGNQAFSRQIIRVKYERLEKIQSEIMELSDVEKMDTITVTHVKHLMDYHDRVKASRESLYSYRSIINLIGSLALPTISAVLSTIDVWQRIFGKP